MGSPVKYVNKMQLNLQNLANRVGGQYRASVVIELVMGLEFRGFAGLWFAKVGRSAHVIFVQLGQKRLVGSFRKHALLLQDRQDSHRL